MAVESQTTRIPPQAVDAEAMVLGAMLLDPEAIPRALELLSDDSFYVAAHRKVFQAISRLFEKNTQADIVTVGEELRRNKDLDSIGGTAFLTTLVENVLSTSHVEEHCRLVADKAIQRKLINVAAQIVEAGFDGAESSDQLLDRAEQLIFGIKEQRLRRGFMPIRDMLRSTLKQVEQLHVQGGRLITGVETGFHDLDERTSGFQPGDLVIIAGRPSMGKTALALNIAVNMARKSANQQAVGMFSLEMAREVLIQRMICSEARVSLHRLRTGKLSRQDLVSLPLRLGALWEAPIFVDDSAGLTVLEIRAKARRLKSETNLGLILVDYLQLIEPPQRFRGDDSRQQEVTVISRSLKAMAKELNVPVVALSQLSRAPERREPKHPRPQLADLRESGALEQDADLVLMLYRDEFYNPESSEKKGQAEVIITKQRNGPVGSFDLKFFGEYMRFDELSVIEEPSVGEEDV
jgi:replicative DNA helicase